MSSLFYMINETNICKHCGHSKDHFRESCYCTQYGIIVTYGKTKCKGYEPMRRKNNEQTDDYRESDERA